MNFFHYVLDPKLLRNLPRYVLQCSLAALVLLGVLLARDALASAVVVAAIGSTAFVLFIMPHSEMAQPRHVLGGHGVALAAGAACAFVDPGVGWQFALGGSIAVGAAMFLMAATNTEHAPAAGSALGIVAAGVSWDLVLLLVLSIVSLAAIHRVLLPWLDDLYHPRQHPGDAP